MEKGNSKIIKVAIIGPESTGKSTLCEKLAKEFNTLYVPEFAREYLTNLNRKYTYEDVLNIGKQQLMLEKEYENKANKILFCDTNQITIKIWLKFVFGEVPNYIDAEIINSVYDRVFLMDIDLPWEPDNLREHPYNREELLDLHKLELTSKKIEYKLISGDYENRFSRAKNDLVNLNP